MKNQPLEEEIITAGEVALAVIDRTGRVRLTRQGYNAAETSFRRDLVQFLKTL